MPTGLRYTNGGTPICQECQHHAQYCRCRRWRVPLHPILITLAIGLTPLVVLYIWLD